MSTIIRATEQNNGVQQVAFNFDDLAGEAHRYLEKVRAQAKQIVVDAQRQAEEIKNKAQAEGRAAGQRTVEQITQQQLAQQLATLLPALGAVTAQIQHAKQAWLAHWEKQALHVAGAIAAKVIRREIDHDPQIPLALLREALEMAAGTSQLRIHLHPADHQTLGPQIPALVGELSGLAAAELIADPQISPGGCRVETRFGVIDQQIEAQLARIEEELT
jgi:flagellar assembly protein FliH